MNETELEELAIKELLLEASTHTVNTVRMEPKVNKLAKPNKKFLSNTLNAVITHNKRKEERIQKNCRQKLKKLEDRRTARIRKQDQNKRSGRCWVKVNENSMSSSDNEAESIIPDEVKITPKRQSEQQTKQNSKKKKRNTEVAKKEIMERKIQYEREESYAKHFAELAAFALATESYNQVGKWLCYQALLAGSYEPYEQNIDVPYDYIEHTEMEVLQPLDSNTTPKDTTISLSSDDEIKEELNLDDDSYFQALKSPCVKYESISLMENCISLDSDEDEEKELKSVPAGSLECQLINEELNNTDEDAIQTIELNDSSDDEDATHVSNINGSIDLTSD